jgi:hypothetical protein
MESLSGNQIKDLKELYASIYKSDDQEISETTANLQGLSKKNMEAMKGDKKDITKEKKDEQIKKEAEKKEEPITINLPNGGTKKIYPASDEYKKIKSGELTTSKSNSSMVPDVTNIKKNEKGEISGELEKVTKSAMGTDVKEIEKQTEIDLKDPKNKVKPEVKPEVKKMHPIEKKNRARFGDAHVDKLKAKNIDFKAMRKGDMTKDAFIKKYPKSITAQKAAGLRDEYEPYDLVLGYVLTEGHADTVEEAHYVMTQMDEETIKAIINEIDNLGGYGAIGGILGAGAVLTNPIINAVKSGTKLIKGIRDKQNKSLEKLKP